MAFALAMAEIFIVFLVFLMGIVFFIILLFPYYKIFIKAGYPGYYCLAMLIPILNIVALFYLALAEWPIERELKDLKAKR